MRTTTPAAALAAMFVVACDVAEPPPTPDRAGASRATAAFSALLDEHWAHANEDQIFFRTDPDAWRPNGALSAHDAAGRDRRKAFNEQMLTRLADIDEQALAPQERASFRVFRYERETERDSYAQFDHFFPFNSLFSYFGYFADAPAAMSFLQAADYERYLTSLDDYPRFNDEHIANMREAITAGMTHYCGSIGGVAETVSVHVVDDVRDSVFFAPFAAYPPSIAEAMRVDLTTRATTAITERVIPAYRKLLAFLEQEYLPECRQDVGITSVANGEDYYRYLIRYFTTTGMSPREVHELGLSEVDRIQGEMQRIIDKLEFDGDFKAFLSYLRSEPAFYAKSLDALLGRAALISKTAEGELPRFFTLLPRGTYNIKANPGRGAYYKPSSGDGTTPGTYFVPGDKLNSRPLYTLEALSLHEGVPGHHLQSALALELDLPAFRRTLYHSAYGEGWGLYSEWLGTEMGFYTDPYSDFGRLTMEAWRACRLVVDTGMHAFGWSRQQAIDYMVENTALSEADIAAEIDRYITWPAQALSYKIGELRIKALRRRAEETLGDDFDLRRFHDTVVGSGSVPIDVLETLVDDWIAAGGR